MKDFLNSLVAHLKAGDLSPKTIKPYEGELKDITKIQAHYPAVYVMLRTGQPFGVQSSQKIRMLTVTKSRVFQANKNQTNIDLVSEVGNYLDENFQFTHNGKAFFVNTGSLITVEPYLISQKFTIYAINIVVNRA